MYGVIDTSTLVSLARSGLVGLIADLPFTPVVLDVVHDESVRAGLAGGHPDAAAIETALSGYALTESAPDTAAVDERVLSSAGRVGLLVSNDLALGRRARNVGAAWLRTADLVVWMVRDGRISTTAGRAAIASLQGARRISEQLASDYLEELE